MNDAHPEQERLDAYLLKELAPAEQEDVAAHLQSCRLCRAKVAILERALQVYRGKDAEEAPTNVLERLLTARATPIHVGQGRAARRRRLPVSLLAAAAAAGAIFMSGFWLGQRQPIVTGGRGAGERFVESPIATQLNPPRITFNPTAADGLEGLAFRDSVPN
jgi:anti-sigma factor RsiW